MAQKEAKFYVKYKLKNTACFVRKQTVPEYWQG